MSAAGKLRECRNQVNRLREENLQLQQKLQEYYKRDRAMAGDFIELKVKEVSNENKTN